MAVAGRPSCSKLYFQGDASFNLYDGQECEGIPAAKRVVLIERVGDNRWVHHCVTIVQLMGFISDADYYGQTPCQLTGAQRQQIKDKFDVYARMYPNDQEITNWHQHLQLRQAQRQLESVGGGDHALPPNIPVIKRG